MIKQIIKQFDNYFKVLDVFDKADIYDFQTRTSAQNLYRSNVRHAADTWTQIIRLWAEKRDELFEWRTSYFNEHRDEIYNKFFMDRGWKLINDNLHSHWRFQEADEEFLANCPDLEQWRNAEQIVRAARERLDMRNCDPEILRRHEGQPCMEGIICLICDEIEWMWYNKVEAEVRSHNNIFLNVASRNSFNGITGDNWAGPAKQESRMVPLSDRIGKTPCKAMQSLIDHMSQIRYIFHSIYMDSDYMMFMNLWNTLEFVDEHIGQAAAECAAIVADL